MPLRQVFFLTVSLSLAFAGTAGAQAAGDPAPDPAPTMLGKYELSIADAIEMGLKNNLDVEVTRYDPLLSWEEFQAAWGAYDPRFDADFGWDSRETPIASSLQATNLLVERELGGRTGLNGKIPWLNATYGVNYQGSHLTTSSSISDLSPENRSGLVASLRVPLLRNLVWDQDWTRVKQTKILYGIEEENFRREVMDTVERIETAYWDLVAAEEAEEVAVKSVETAQELLRQTETQYEVGVVSRVEVTEAEAGLAQREVELIRAANAHDNSMDFLMDEVLGRGLRPDSRLEVVAADRPDDYIVYEIDVAEAARKAFENRPELAGARQEIERRQIEVKFRNNQKLPQLDVEASYGFNGLSGITNSAPSLFGGPRAPIVGVPGYYWGSHNTFDNAQDASVRGLFSIPLLNKTARSNSTRANIDLRKAGSQLARLEQDIILSVRVAARNLEAAQGAILAAERAVVAAEEQLRAERIRLEQGESTPFDVLLREQDYVGSQSALIDAIRIYRNSTVALDRQQGTILKTRNVMIDQVRALR